MAVDPEEALEAVNEWLPDFLACAERPGHPDSQALYDRGLDRIVEHYMLDAEGETPAELVADRYELSVIANEVALILSGVAEWVLANTAPKEKTDGD